MIIIPPIQLSKFHNHKLKPTKEEEEVKHWYKEKGERYLSETSSEGTAEEGLQEWDLRPGAEIRHWNKEQNESRECWGDLWVGWIEESDWVI